MSNQEIMLKELVLNFINLVDYDVEFNHNTVILYINEYHPETCINKKSIEQIKKFLNDLCNINTISHYPFGDNFFIKVNKETNQTHEIVNDFLFQNKNIEFTYKDIINFGYENGQNYMWVMFEIPEKELSYEYIDYKAAVNSIKNYLNMLHSVHDMECTYKI